MLDHSVWIAEAARTARLQAHTLCLIAQSLLCAYAPESASEWAMPLQVTRPASGGLAIDIGLRPLRRGLPVRQQTVDQALQGLCCAMSRPGSVWQHEILPGPDAGLAVRIRIL